MLNQLLTLHRWRAAAAAVFGLVVVSGCSVQDMPVVDTQGPVAQAQLDMLIRASWIMLLVILPVIVMAILFAWRYRASNFRARYEPNWMSVKLDTVVWIIPAVIVIAIAVHVWIFTHKLDPYKPIESNAAPLEIQVVAQDWKWLFIYPEQQIASVNELAIPSGVPITLKITSDTVMNSFFIPSLAGQIYAMAGMQTQLNLLANEPGNFIGRNTQFSGEGFADQYFQTLAMSEDDFATWVTKVKSADNPLDAKQYKALAKPSVAHPVVHYSSVEPDLFVTIMARYDSGMNGSMTKNASAE